MSLLARSVISRQRRNRSLSGLKRTFVKGAQGYLKRLRIALILADWLEVSNLKAPGYEQAALPEKVSMIGIFVPIR